jgi:peptide/nickel transport system substrate-binding protein
VIPLTVLPEVMVVKDGLVNFGAATFEQPDFTTVGFRAKR